MDLPASHSAYQSELDEAISGVVRSGQFIGGPVVDSFENELGTFLQTRVVSVGNGTDALQIALMALGIGPGDEVIVPAFTYVASAEVIVLLGATPVWCDVDVQSFNIDPASAQSVLSERTKAVIAVHLFGQCADIESLEKHLPGVPIIEDNAQSMGAKFTQGKYAGAYAGTVGSFGTLSFFPTKTLGGMGDGGAVVSSNEQLLDRARQIARHGQKRKYEHLILGVNSRLDPIQAAVLSVKLRHLPRSFERKMEIANSYTSQLASCPGIELPTQSNFSTHVFHQFTLKVLEGKRDALASFLAQQGIASMVYYPIPLNEQPAYQKFTKDQTLTHSKSLSKSVLSIPIHDALTNSEVHYISESISQFFNS